MLVLEGYFLRKLAIFLENSKKMPKIKKKLFFTFHRLLTTLTLGFWRKKIFQNFPNQFHIRISKFQPILAFCLGQRWVKVLVTSTVKIFVKKLIEAIVNMYMKTGKIWNGSSCPAFAHKRTHYRGGTQNLGQAKKHFF